MFDRDLRGSNPASRVLGVGHTLFDIALDEARDLPARIAILDGISAPVLVLSVEDEVTGTGSLVHRLIFGIMDADGEPTSMRDWELLRLLNCVRLKTGGSEPESGAMAAEHAATVDRLKTAFESGLSERAPALRRPVCWPEMLFLPADSGSSDTGAIPENAPTSAG